MRSNARCSRICKSDQTKNLDGGLSLLPLNANIFGVQYKMAGKDIGGNDEVSGFLTFLVKIWLVIDEVKMFFVDEGRTAEEV